MRALLLVSEEQDRLCRSYLEEGDNLEALHYDSLRSRAVDNVAVRIGVCSRSLNNWRSRFVERRGVLSHSPGAGAPRKLDHDEVNDALLEIADEYNYEVTYELILLELRLSHNITISVGTLRNIMAEYGWGKYKKIVKPYLSIEQRCMRLVWARKMRSLARKELELGIVRVHVDEKWFYATRRGKVVYLPQHLALSKARFQGDKSKRFRPQVMFIAAVAAPSSSFGVNVCGDEPCDGRIYFEAIGKEVPCLNNSINFDAGDWKWENSTLDGAGFRKHLTAIKAAARAAYPKATEIVIQFDGAGGHGVSEEKVAAMNAEMAKADKAKKIPVRYELQPPQSPDFNLLDLGAWRSLSTAVLEVKFLHSKQGDKAGCVMLRLIDNCRDAWESWWENSAAPEKNPIASLIESLQNTLQKVVRERGGNEFIMPHFRGKKYRKANK